MSDDRRPSPNAKGKTRTTVSRSHPAPRHIRPRANTISVREAVAGYLLARTDWPPYTRERAAYHFDLFVRFAESAAFPPAQELANTHIRAYLASLHRLNPRTGKPLSQGYRNKVGSLLRTWCKWLIAEGIAVEDLTHNIQWPRAPKLTDTMIPVAANDIERLITACDGRTWHGVRDLAILLVLLDTGVRRGEMLGLTVSDVEAVDRAGAVVTGKSGTRAIGMGTMARRAVREYLQRARYVVGTEHDALWIARSGEPLGKKGLELVLKRLATAAGIEGRIYPHKLRHTFATWYLRNGGNAFSLQMALGHTSTVVTSQYVHLVNADVENSMTKFSPADGLLKTKRSRG